MKRFAATLFVATAFLAFTKTAATQAPATDSSAQASPIGASSKAPATDSSAQASPTLGAGITHPGASLAPGTPIQIKLTHAIDSGHLKNGQTIPATLTAPVRTSAGTTLREGTTVDISVIATVPAGKLMAVGEFSLQALRVGSVSLYTDTQTYRGKPGHRDLPDSVPTTGTNAGLPTGATLTFHVLKPPTAATSAPKTTAHIPGSVNGVASGSASPPKPSNAKN